MNLRMLVVEDEENIRESIAVLLELEGYEVVTATNGAEALRILAEEAAKGGEDGEAQAPFGLIILDLMMPQMDGWSFRARQLQQPVLRDIPVIVLSGLHQVERETREMNPVAVLQKPVGVQQLLETLQPFLRDNPARA